MRKVPGFHMWPACCAACGTTEGSAVDLERQVEGYHIEKPYRLYLCDACALEIAELYEFVTPEAFENAMSHLEIMKGELEATREREGALSGAIQALGDAKILAKCHTCQWVGKSLKQHARYCDIEECPHRKAEEKVEVEA